MSSEQGCIENLLQRERHGRQELQRFYNHICYWFIGLGSGLMIAHLLVVDLLCDNVLSRSFTSLCVGGITVLLIVLSMIVNNALTLCALKSIDNKINKNRKAQNEQ